MGPYPFGSGTATSRWAAADSGLQCSASDIDGLLAAAGYRVRSSDLLHIAHSLKRLESAIGEAPADHLASAESVHYNPSGLTAWVDSILSELSPSLPPPRPPPAAPVTEMWPHPMCFPLVYPQYQTAVVATTRQLEEEEEGSAIRLVHLLVSCAEAVQRGDSGLAGNIIEEMQVALTRVNTDFGIGKVARYFVDALCRRIYSPCPSSSRASVAGSAADQEILYHHFYEVSPCLKFAHFMANQAILEAFDGYGRVHVIDFNLMHGLQWPALIQALALRAGGPPFLRLTGIGPPSPDGRDALREVGLRLAELARSVRVRFAFRGVAASRIDDVRPWMLQVFSGEAVAVNSVLQLHRLLGEPGDDAAAPIRSVLGWIVGLQPKIVTVVEQEVDHNRPAFLDRFTEALFYYSSMFDSLDAGRGAAQQQQQQAMAEVYLQREICNIVCCEGAARLERHEPLVRWRARLGRAGLRALHLGSNAFNQASMLLTLFSGEGYCVEEVDGFLTLGWHSRPLIFASAWRADDNVAPPPDNKHFNTSMAATTNCTRISRDDDCSNNFQSMHHGSGSSNAPANNHQNNASSSGNAIGMSNILIFSSYH